VLFLAENIILASDIVFIRVFKVTSIIITINVVVVVVELLETWHIISTVLDVAGCFAHPRIEWLDEGLARKLDTVVKASYVVSFVKRIFKPVKGSDLDAI